MFYWHERTIGGFTFGYTDGRLVINPQDAQPNNPAWTNALREALKLCAPIDALYELRNNPQFTLYKEGGSKLIGAHFQAILDAGWDIPEDLEDIYDEYRGVLSGEETRARRTEEQEAKRAEQEARRKQPDPGFVYLVQAPDGYYKIGRAKNVNDRIRTFNVKLPMPVELAHVIKCERYCLAERALHERYAHRRAQGEWFALTPEEVAEIKAIKDM